ncbi:MAG: PhzF family phenazine biosynthesis protein, partial [Acidimicrobiia bacterium]|nr:PhzF family phenazine biosynthesis protein [Acidimicrobiia bacterium]
MRTISVLRVFTRGDIGGNHLGVVAEVADLDTASMQQIAAELGYSETIFLVRRDSGAPLVRIFTPAAEMPFAGHPLVGAAWTAAQGPAGMEGKLACAVGEIPYRVSGGEAWVDTPMVGDVETADDGAGIASESRLPSTGRIWWARMPIPYLIVEAPSAAAVAGATPDFGALLSGPAAEAAYLFSRTGDRVKA